MAEIAHGEIKIDLNDREAIANLRKLDAEFDRTMAKIEREHAVATVEGNIAPLEDKIANAKRELKILAAQKAEATVEADTKQFNARIKEVKAEIRQLEAEKATVELDVKGEEKVLRALAKVEAAKRAQAKAGEDAIKRE